MDAAEWLDAWLLKRSQMGPLSVKVDEEIATCRQDAINDGLDLQELKEAAGGDLASFLSSKAA